MPVGLLLLVFFLLATAAGFPPASWAQGAQQLPGVAERDMGEAPAGLSIGDPLAVFDYLLRQSPDRAPVLPTENYYYVRFTHRGAAYTGNIRLAAADRDSGKVHFAYGLAPSDRRPSPRVRHVVLGTRENVNVTPISPFEYRVSLRGRDVVFALHDMGAIKPTEGLLRPDERFLGAIFDESAVRFFLVFNVQLRVFHYLLDEAGPLTDEWTPTGTALLIGKRTGFAFYRGGERKVLVGVGARDSRLNTMFDGPFDQLPENSIAGDALRDAIVAADPSASGKIDRLGHYLDGSGRYLIHPYLPYRSIADLAVFHRCVTAVSTAQRPRCLVIGDEQASRRKPLPLALQRR